MRPGRRTRSSGEESLEGRRRGDGTHRALGEVEEKPRPRLRCRRRGREHSPGNFAGRIDRPAAWRRAAWRWTIVSCAGAVIGGVAGRAPRRSSENAQIGGRYPPSPYPDREDEGLARPFGTTTRQAGRSALVRIAHRGRATRRPRLFADLQHRLGVAGSDPAGHVTPPTLSFARRRRRWRDRVGSMRASRRIAPQQHLQQRATDAWLSVGRRRVPISASGASARRGGSVSGRCDNPGSCPPARRITAGAALRWRWKSTEQYRDIHPPAGTKPVDRAVAAGHGSQRRSGRPAPRARRSAERVEGSRPRRGQAARSSSRVEVAHGAMCRLDERQAAGRPAWIAARAYAAATRSRVYPLADHHRLDRRVRPGPKAIRRRISAGAGGALRSTDPRRAW